MFKKLQLLIRKFFLLPVAFYRNFISPHLPKSCIYHPSCSSYFTDSVLRHGIFKGFLLGIARIFRCTSLFFVGGDDPVPDKFSFREVVKGYKEFRRGRKKPPSDPPSSEN